MRKGLYSKLVSEYSGLPFPAKLTCLLVAFMLFTYTQVTASVGLLASTVTIEVSNEKVSTILREIEEHTGCQFIYESNTVDLNYLTSIKADDELIDAVLTELLAGQNLKYRLADGNKIIIMSENSRETIMQAGDVIKVTGVIQDETGPLPGVTVVISGTTNGTITDLDGKYSLSGVPANGSITFSFIGMETQTIEVKGRTSIDVTMSAGNIALDEVIAVGYGTQTKGSLTAAVEQVSAKEISELPVSNLSESLQGVIPGLNISNVSSRPGQAADVSIRQTFSLSKDGGNSVPLVIIDDVMQLDANTGLPTLDQFNNLDPSEIEDITVLKDASAAIYGARAAQGAIIVTTKRGKKGKPRISYSGQMTYNDAISHGKTLDGTEYGNYWNTLVDITGDAEANDLYSINELYDMSQADYNWLDEAWKASITQRHSLGVSGGSDRATYYAGLSVFDQGANLGSQDYQRYNFRANVSVDVANGLKFTSNLSANKGTLERSYTKSSSGIRNGYAEGTRSDYAPLLHMPGHIPWQVEYQGEEYFFSPLMGTTIATTASSINSKTSMAGWNYFANEASGAKSAEESMSYNANFGLEYKVPFIKGLSVKATYSIQQSYTEGDQVALPVELLYQENTDVANNHLYNPNGNFGVGVNNAGGDLQILYDSNYNKRDQYNFYLNYSGEFGEHTVSAMAAVERSEGYRSSQRQIYSNPDDPYLGGSSTAGDIQDGSYIMRYQNASMSYIGRVNYSYKNRYLASFLLRTDASTKFAPENYWAMFPSLSIGWILSEEPWFESALSWVDYLKVRYSVGITGKDNIRAWLWLQQYDYSNDGGIGFGEDGGNRVEGLKPGKTPNRDVQWDKTYKNNFGIDASVLDNRLSLGFDFYYDMLRDMLTVMSAQLGSPITTGGAFTEQNFSSIDAWGYEAKLQWRDKINNDLRYSIGINFGHGYNKVVKYFDSNYRYPADIRMKEGESTIRPSYGYKVWRETSGGDGILRTQEDIDNYWEYLSQNSAAAGSDGAYYFGATDKSQMRLGNLAYQDRYGKPAEDGSMTEADGRIGEDGSQDFYELEKANSRHGFVTNLGVTYKSFRLKTQISTSWGGVRYIDRVQSYTDEFFWNPESFWADMYSPDTPMVGSYPISSESGNLRESDFWTVNSFRCFIRNISLSYDLPKNWMNSIGVERAAFTLTGYNMWDFYNPYPDKYRNMYDSSTSGYPTLRSWSLGVNVSF